MAGSPGPSSGSRACRDAATGLNAKLGEVKPRHGSNQEGHKTPNGDPSADFRRGDPYVRDVNSSLVAAFS